MDNLPDRLHALASRLAAARGTTMETAVQLALEEALATPPVAAASVSQTEKDDFVRRIEEISARYRALPILDSRSADEILGYDEFGVPR